MCGKLLLSIYQHLIKKLTKGYGLSNYRPIKAIMKNAEKKIKTDFAYVQGSKMFLDPTDSLRLSIDGVYGILDTETIKNQISKNEIAIDVGANIGYYTLLFSKLVGSNGKVFAFEPEHNNYCLLKKNITTNNYSNIISEEKAVSDTSGDVNLYLAEDGIVGHRIYNSKKFNKSVKVQKIVLDDYFSKLQLLDKINFVKIDVEGFEFGVLKGMEKIIKNSKNLKLFVEFNRVGIEEAGFEPTQVLDFLYENDFKIFFLDYKKHSVVEADRMKLLTSKENLEENINILCIKKNS